MPNIIGILVCNNQKVLDHKRNDGKKSAGGYCYWEMTRFPRRVLDVVFPETSGTVSESAKAPGFGFYSEDDMGIPFDFEVRLYFAVKGSVLGYFVCKAIGERHGKYELRFHSESWTPINPIHVYPTQGFRYFEEKGES